MLASDEDGSTLDALKFSLASDIVELVVLTADDAFLQTLRDAVGGARRLWHVPSADKVSDLLVAGEVGIVVIDVDLIHLLQNLRRPIVFQLQCIRCSENAQRLQIIRTRRLHPRQRHERILWPALAERVAGLE